MEKLQRSDTKYTSHIERQYSINYTLRNDDLVIVNLLCYNPTTQLLLYEYRDNTL